MIQPPLFTTVSSEWKAPDLNSLPIPGGERHAGDKGDMTKLTIYIGSDGYNVRVPEDVALREFDAWALFEQRSADAIADARASFGGEAPYFPEEFYVRRVTGLDPDTGELKTVAYRFHDLTNIVAVQEKNEAPA